MDTIEIVASSVDEAREQAAAELGVSSDQIEVKVVEETKGLFGRPGKVKVSAQVAGAPAKKPARAAKATKPKAEAPAPEPEAVAPAKASAKKPTAKKAAPAAAAPTEEGQEATEARPEAVATQEDADRMLEILNSIFAAGDLEASAKLDKLNGRYINIEVDGDDVGYLVGRRGEVLNALQFLANVIASRQLHNGVRVSVEGDNYRKRREDILTKLATDIATAVQERGEEAVLDALPAFERRIVHQALVEFAGVTTYSEGEEPNRRVVIAPAE